MRARKRACACVHAWACACTCVRACVRAWYALARVHHTCECLCIWTVCDVFLCKMSSPHYHFSFCLCVCCAVRLGVWEKSLQSSHPHGVQCWHADRQSHIRFSLWLVHTLYIWTFLYSFLSLFFFWDCSVQFKMVSTCSEKSIWAPLRLSEVSPALPLKRLQCSSDWRWPSLVLWLFEMSWPSGEAFQETHNGAGLSNGGGGGGGGGGGARGEGLLIRKHVPNICTFFCSNCPVSIVVSKTYVQKKYPRSLVNLSNANVFV